MTGKKRTVNGQIKPQTKLQQQPENRTMAEPTPSKTTKSESTTEALEAAMDKPAQHTSTPHTTSRKNRQKRPKLPANATITKRPLLHPALPTPFASSGSPKTLYITASTPYIPTLKRIRLLLTQITKRAKQSNAAAQKRQGRRGGFAEANGRLEARDVEREIADEAARRLGAEGKGGEEVYLKATGRAIPRALEMGVHFQAEVDCRVRVEMGSVCAVDDVEVKAGEEDVDVDVDIPETRIRTLSSVTVSIGLK